MPYSPVANEPAVDELSVYLYDSLISMMENLFWLRVYVEYGSGVHVVYTYQRIDNVLANNPKYWIFHYNKKT